MHVLYVLDTETTGTDERIHDVIELSLYRLTDNSQKTFYIQPVNWDTIQEDALRVNGHKLEDLKKGFRLNEDGTKTVYNPPQKALVEIEQFLMEDLVTAAERGLAGHNVTFDIRFLQELWRRGGQEDTYPFGRMFLDTFQIAFFIDYVNNAVRDGGYHLNGVVKAYDVKKEKAHRADADVRMTKDVLLKLVEAAKKLGAPVSAETSSSPAPAPEAKPKKGRAKKPTAQEVAEAKADQAEADDIAGKNLTPSEFVAAAKAAGHDSLGLCSDEDLDEDFPRYVEPGKEST